VEDEKGAGLVRSGMRKEQGERGEGENGEE
jgi:hypothetical protein